MPNNNTNQKPEQKKEAGEPNKFGPNENKDGKNAPDDGDDKSKKAENDKK